MRLFGYELLKVQEPYVGVNSTLELGDNAEWWEHHALQIDYDNNLTEDALLREISRLQKTYALGTCCVFESSPERWFVLFPRNVLTYWECLQVLHDTPADRKFKMVRMVHKCSNLRVSEKRGLKPVLRHVLERKSHDSKKFRKQCRAYERAFMAGLS